MPARPRLNMGNSRPTNRASPRREDASVSIEPLWPGVAALTVRPLDHAPRDSTDHGVGKMVCQNQMWGYIQMKKARE